jgi:hypothetical protein
VGGRSRGGVSKYQKLRILASVTDRLQKKKFSKVDLQSTRN